MLINLSKLKNLPVYTKSGQFLGKIEDLKFDAESQAIVNYIIRSGGLVNRLTEPKLIINVKQVVNLTDEKMEVEDNLSFGNVVLDQAAL